MSKSHGLVGLEGTPKDLLEVLYIDGGVVVIETKKWLITCIVV